MTESEEQTVSKPAKQESKISTTKSKGNITKQQWLERSSFHYGDIVMAWKSKIGKFGNSKPWFARIEFVCGTLCPMREQKHYPWEGNIKSSSNLRDLVRRRPKDLEYDHDFRYLPELLKKTINYQVAHLFLWNA